MNIQRVQNLGYEDTQYAKYIHNNREEAPHCLKQSAILLKIAQGLVQDKIIIIY